MDASPGRRHQLDALADPTRRAILELLRERPLTAGEIAARFSQQRPAISKHLTLLRTTGWLAESRDRQRRIYSLRSDAVVVVVDWARRLGEGHQSPERQRAGESAYQSRPPTADQGAVGVPKRETTISDLKDQMMAVDASVNAHEQPCEGVPSEHRMAADAKYDHRLEAGATEIDGMETGATRQAARSSFELIFD